MRIFKRWTSGVVASFDWVANQVENHEALVAAAIAEMQEAAAKARMQMQRVQKDGEKLREQLEKSKADVDNWLDRAKRCPEEDQEKALECIRRKRRAEQEVKYLKEKLTSHSQLERQLKQDLEAVQTRLSELRRKKNSFLARKYNSDAQKAGSFEHVGLMHEIDDLFERWELRIAQCEPFVEPVDSFAKEFEDDEERQDLLSEFAALKDQSA